MNNTNQVHPIEFFIACIINLIEFIAWTINEIAGHHTTAPATATYAQTGDIIDMTPEEFNQSLIIPTQPLKPIKEDWLDYVTTLTVKQLRTLTGITNSRFNKARLIEVAASYA